MAGGIAPTVQAEPLVCAMLIPRVGSCSRLHGHKYGNQFKKGARCMKATQEPGLGASCQMQDLAVTPAGSAVGFPP